MEKGELLIRVRCDNSICVMLFSGPFILNAVLEDFEVSIPSQDKSRVRGRVLRPNQVLL